MPQFLLKFFILLAIVLLPFSALHAANKFMPAQGEDEFKATDKQLTELIGLAEEQLITIAGLDIVRASLGKISTYHQTTQPAYLRYADLPEYDQTVYQQLLDVHAKSPAFGLVMLGTQDGGFVQAPEFDTLFAGFDPRKRTWYMDGMKAREDINLSRTYQSTSGEVVSCMTRRVYSLEGKPIGYLGLDITLSAITSQFNRLAKNKDDFVVIIDKGGLAADFISIADNNSRPAMLGQGGVEALLPAYDCVSCSWVAKIDDKPRTLSSHTSAVLGWKVIVVAQ